MNRKMKDNSNKRYGKCLNDELLAAFLEGNASLQETMAIAHAAHEHDEISSVIEIYEAVNKQFNEDFTSKDGAEIVDLSADMGDQLPYTAMAATTTANDCVWACERYIMMRMGMECDDRKLREVALKNNWLNERGTPLYNIGRLLEWANLSVARRFEGTIDMLSHEIEEGCHVIVAVDGNELLGNYDEEKVKDFLIGETANHAVVVSRVDLENDFVEVHDPQSKQQIDRYPMEQFLDAWEDSHRFMVSVIEKGRRSYIPSPIDISDVTLSDELLLLTEAIAENVHEVWASKRMDEGWTYGPSRNDMLKQTPCMVPYSELSDKEKEYDRATAMQSIKLLQKLGYVVEKRPKR